MADSSDDAATGGFLVILGIVIAILVGVLLFKGGFFDNGPDIKIEAPEAPAVIKN